MAEIVLAEGAIEQLLGWYEKQLREGRTLTLTHQDGRIVSILEWDDDELGSKAGIQSGTNIAEAIFGLWLAEKGDEEEE